MRDGDFNSPVKRPALERLDAALQFFMAFRIVRQRFEFPDQVEHVFVEPGSPEAEAVTRREPISPAARARLVLVMLALLSVAAVLLVWGLVR